MSEFSRLLLSRLLRTFRLSESFLLGTAAVITGLSTGLGIWAFKAAISLVERLYRIELGGWLTGLHPWAIAALPMMGGLLVGWLGSRLIAGERHHGVAGIIEAAALAGGRLNYRRLPVKSLAAVLSISSGASVGPEDPSVQIGANIGSFLGQKANLSDERMRVLLAAGAASGIAAAFNAPVAGVFFSLEIILGELSSSALGVVVLSAVVASVFTQAVSGAQPAFPIPAYTFNSIWEFGLYLALGVVTGPLAALYSHLLYWFRDQFGRLEHWPAWLRTALTGLVVGLVGLAFPQVLGVGYETISAVLANKLVFIPLLLGIALAKLVLTPFSLAGGFWGGLFAPALFIGAALGAAFGNIAALLFPTLPLSPPAYALVGMAAFLGGTVHAPLTAILLLFEMTHDYRIILPLMFAVIVSLYVSRKLQPASVYLQSLHRKGIYLQSGRDIEILDTIQVQEVMLTQPHVLREDMNLHQAAEIFQSTRHHGLPVLDAQGNLTAILTLQDLEQVALEDWSTVTVGQVGNRDLITIFPDETIGTALRRMGAADVGRLPVVDRQDPQRLVGVLRRSDAIRAYEIALARRAALRQRSRQVRLSASSEGAQVWEIKVQTGSRCAHQNLQNVAWPKECLIASVQRKGRILIPHGQTILQPGDILLVIADPTVRESIERICAAPASDASEMNPPSESS